MTDFKLQIFSRLEPRTHQFKGGRIVDTDVLTLDEAAKFASNHAGAEITQGDFLRAAARGEITLRAIVHRTAKLQKHDGGIYCNQGMPTENTAPQGAILNLPLSACQQLASAGRAAWRTFDGFENRSGELMRFTVARLIDSEPDFETAPVDCRVTGDAVHALADEYADVQAAASSGTPKEAKPTDNAGSMQYITTHKIDTRTNALTAVISEARKKALCSKDAHSIWAAFVAMAEDKNRPFPLLGYVETEGVKYQEETGVAFINKENFLRRVRRKLTDKNR